jgi:Arginine deiminase
VIGHGAVMVLSTDEDIRAAEREQWDDGTNYLPVAPGVIVGYERNVTTNTMPRKVCWLAGPGRSSAAERQDRPIAPSRRSGIPRAGGGR